MPAIASPLAVLAVSHAAAPWGAERRLLDLAPALRELDVVLTLAAPAGELAEVWRDLGLAYEPLQPPGARGMRRDDGARAGAGDLARQGARTLRAAREIVEIARRARPAVLHSHALNAHLDVALAGVIARRPAVIDLHDIVVPGLGRRVLGAAARLADVVIANSTATAATVSTGRVEIVNPGVDLARFGPGAADPALRAELTADPAAPLVAILGRIDPEKGVDVVLRAVAAVDGAHAVVVGAPNVADESFAAELRSLGTALLGARVRFVGPRADVPDVLRAVDVLVNASRNEPFGRTVLEAQASGVPVVGTDAGGIPEFVAHEVSGLLVAPGDVDALAAAIRRLVHDHDLRARLREGGLRSAQARAVPVQAAKVASIYRSVAR